MFFFYFQCEVGSKLKLQVGGDFFYNPSYTDPSRDLLLIAGGVGANPIVSIFRHAAYLHKNCSNDKSLHKPGKVHMLFSAKSKEELIFKVGFLYPVLLYIFSSCVKTIKVKGFVST